MTKKEWKYVDPYVKVGRNVICKLNLLLARKQGLDKDNIQQIKALHTKKHLIEQALFENAKWYQINFKPSDDALVAWTKIQYQLQEAWGFTMNKNYHRFWEIPGCSCPKLDNEDAWPTGHWWVNESCPWHGKGKLGELYEAFGSWEREQTEANESEEVRGRMGKDLQAEREIYNQKYHWGQM